jgi:hypothetical protein
VAATPRRAAIVWIFVEPQSRRQHSSLWRYVEVPDPPDVFGTTPLATAVVALQDDGKIVVVSETCCLHVDAFAMVAVGATELAGDFALARYNVNGSLDTTFSGDGEQTTDFLGADDEAKDLAIQANGRIVTVGFAGAAPPATTSRSLATTPTAPSTQRSREMAGGGRTLAAPTSPTAWPSKATAGSSPPAPATASSHWPATSEVECLDLG